MTATGGSASLDAPRSLVVVGAAAGMGRWLVDHLLLDRRWDRVVLVDTVEAAPALRPVRTADGTMPVIGCVDPTGVLVELDDRDEIRIDDPSVTVVVAVPRDALSDVSARLGSRLAPDATICAVSVNQTATLDVVRRHWTPASVFGLHPLFDSSARSVEGQTLLVVDDVVAAGMPAGGHGEAAPGAPSRWLCDLIAASGGISDSGSAADHDAIMAYVQATTHQALLSFADTVASSGLDLERVWEARTPLFESLFGLAVRVLSEHQQSTVADIQLSMGGSRVAAELAAASERLRTAVDSGSGERIEAVVGDVRDRFSGALFETVQATAVAAVTAAQAKRSDLARHRRLGSLVGVRPLNRPEALRVGHIDEVTPVSVTIREVMVGRHGAATLIEGPGRRNAGRIGMNGTATSTTFGLGHIDVVVGAELEEALDEWLAFIRRDVRFLVPESVAGLGVLTIVSNHAGVRDAAVISEVVRTGQRSVVIRVFIRADLDVEDMVEQLRSQVQATYRWPRGLSLAASGIARVHYLGPAGTFSEAAARQALASVEADDAELVTHEDFAAVIAAVGERSLGVLPISSSASGLVTRAVSALRSHPGDLVAGGVVDVAVRIDAYVSEGRQLTDLRGATVYSHPQALGQCQAFIRRWGLVPVPCSSTTEALRLVGDDPNGSVALAAAESSGAGRLKVAEREVDDLSGSITRFLILGARDTFGELTGGWDPTLRSIWVADSVATVVGMIEPGAPAFDELLTDADGRCLWVTSRVHTGSEPDGARYLGRAPWSPRTPVVRVEVDVPRDRT